MGHSYQAVGWNAHKRRYDLWLAIGIAIFLAVFVGLGRLTNPFITAETLVIRATATAALLLLHVILSIGPLARLDPRFLPLLYNRRHLGVSMFLLALTHGGLSIFQFHALGELNPLVSVLAGNGSYAEINGFPFQALGLAALVILFLMAATSHDFWLANLGPMLWKQLHLGVYLAYGLVILHVATGALQVERHPLLTLLLGLGMLWVLGLHLLSGRREAGVDRAPARGDRGGFVELCALEDLPEKQGRVFRLEDARVALFRYDGRISALSNVCAHQGGPLGEGRIIEGCVTCPWHGYQYLPASGQSPPPFSERVPTYRVRIEAGRVLVGRRPEPPGSPVEPAVIDAMDREGAGRAPAAQAAEGERQ